MPPAMHLGSPFPCLQRKSNPWMPWELHPPSKDPAIENTKHTQEPPQRQWELLHAPNF